MASWMGRTRRMQGLRCRIGAKEGIIHTCECIIRQVKKVGEVRSRHIAALVLFGYDRHCLLPSLLRSHSGQRLVVGREDVECKEKLKGVT